jgi:hypothetical protein
MPSAFLCITCFIRQFLRNIWPIQLNVLRFIVCRMFLCSSSVCNICSYFLQSVQLIFSILLLHQIAGLWRNFWSAFWSVQVSVPYAAVLEIKHFTSFFLKFKSNLLVESFLRVESHLHHGSAGFIFTLAFCIACYQAIKIRNIPHSPFLIYHNLWRCYFEVFMWGDSCRKFSLHFVFKSQPTPVSEVYSVNNLSLIHITRTCSPSLMRWSVLNVPVAWHISLVADNFLTVTGVWWTHVQYKRIFPSEKLLPEEV